MDLELSRREMPGLMVLDSVASTNSELSTLATSGAAEPYAALLTFDQTAGRGRLDRSWVAPRGTALAVSVLVPFAPETAGWIPLAAGIAMTEAVNEELETGQQGTGRARLKWPNDVLIDDRKVCGILAELTSGGVVVGAGLNVGMTTDQLPVPTATSLAIAGAEVGADLVDRVLAGYLRRLRVAIDGLATAGPEPLRARVVAACSTLGREVRVELPDGTALLGEAVGLDADGRLVVETAPGRRSVVGAGDVTHVRTL